MSRADGHDAPRTVSSRSTPYAPIGLGWPEITDEDFRTQRAEQFENLASDRIWDLSESGSVQGFDGTMAVHEVVRFGRPGKGCHGGSAGQRLHPWLDRADRRKVSEGGDPGRLHFRVAS